jgi:hypothetical protein
MISRDTSPPFTEWEKLLSAFAIREEDVHRFDTGKLLQRLEDYLFDGLRLRNVADDHPLNWLKGSKEAKNGILARIPVGNHSAMEIVVGLGALIAARAKLSTVQPSVRLLSEKARIDQELVFVRTERSNEYVTGKPTFHYYAHVSQEWARFFVELHAIDKTLTELTLQCLQEGRVICVEQDGAGWALLLPSYWETRSGLGGQVKSQFILTCDLPDAWFGRKMAAPEIVDRKKKAEALRWLYAQYQLPNRPHDLQTKDAVLGVLETKFGMKTSKVRKEVWDEAPISNWRVAGRPKNS